MIEEAPFNFSRDESQNGAVIVLIAMLLIAIFGLAALAIDVTSYSTKLSQARNSANLAALAALEESTAGPVNTYLTRALDRAEKVSGFNISIGSEQANRLDSSATETSSTGNAKLVAGKYYYEAPSDSNPCGTYPCFVAGVPSGSRPSAFKVLGELFQPHAFSFAKAAFGSSAASKPVAVQSVATVVPRRGCFLVAGSPSNEIRITHLLSGTDQADSAYRLDDTNSNTRWTSLSASRGGVTPSSRIDTKHFQSDYIDSSSATHSGVAGVISDSDYNSNADFNKYHPSPPAAAVANGGLENITALSALIKRDWKWDAYPPSIMNGYNGPEPMGTIFEGLVTALNIFKQRAVTGDEACVIFFQRNVRWPAVVKLTSDFDYILKLVDSNALDSSGVRVWANRTEWIKNLYQHNIFPELSSQTDMNAAFAEALRQFTAERTAKPGMPAAEFMVLISDGIQTCYNCPPRTGSVPFDQNNDKVVDGTDRVEFQNCFNGTTLPQFCSWADSNGDGSVLNDIADKSAFDKAYNDPANACAISGTSCSNEYENYVQGVQNVTKLVRENLVSQKIPIHVIQIGPHVAPYSVDVETDPARNPKKCLTEYEKRATQDAAKLSVPTLTPGCTSVNGSLGIRPTLLCDPVRKNSFTCRDPGTAGCTGVTRFNESNSFMYQIALMTHGLWAPIREPDTGCSTPEGKCNPGIVLKDPKCRTTQAQMTDHVKEIMGQNPYTIAEQ